MAVMNGCLIPAPAPGARTQQACALGGNWDSAETRSSSLTMIVPACGSGKVICLGVPAHAEQRGPCPWIKQVWAYRSFQPAEICIGLDSSQKVGCAA